MRVDLDANGDDLNSIPRFQRAPLHARWISRFATLFLSVAILVLIANRWVSTSSLWRLYLDYNGVALLLLGITIQASYGPAYWRCHACGNTPRGRLLRWLTPPLQHDTQAFSPHRIVAKPATRLWTRLLRPLSGARQLLQSVGVSRALLFCLGAASLTALIICIADLRLHDLAIPARPLRMLAVVLTLVPTFALLVLERYLTAASQNTWPEATYLARMTRMTLLMIILFAMGLLWLNEQRSFVIRVALLMGWLPLCIAAELLLHVILALFQPPLARVEPILTATSAIVNLMRWPLRPLHDLHTQLHNRFGIDLRHNWAFAFVRRTFPAVLSIMLLIGWSLTGLVEVAMDQRGVYERFGAPVQVLQPGLHAVLPWPLGAVKRVENGIVHSVPADFDTAVTTGAVSDLSSADGTAPESANRLWDDKHDTDRSQIIADESDERQSFQVVNMDVSFIYRIGLSDQAALQALYQQADLQSLLLRTANNVLVKQFAMRTLDDVLSAQRVRLSTDIHLAVQRQLDAMHSGVELLSTIVEATHPPAGAADAYHRVQASLITATALVARERGNAAAQVDHAQLLAITTQDKAVANARDNQSTAQAALLRFDAEREAFHQAGKAFLMEHYLEQLEHGLATAQLVIVDHRINSVSPTIDLRTLAPLTESGVHRVEE